MSSWSINPLQSIYDSIITIQSIYDSTIESKLLLSNHSQVYCNVDVDVTIGIGHHIIGVLDDVIRLNLSVEELLRVFRNLLNLVQLH